MESDRKEALSERERQIAKLASEGLTDKEIARNLRVSVTTVRTYWNRMRRKLGAANRAQAIVRSLDGFLDSTPEMRNAFRKVIDTCLLGVVVIDGAGQIVQANDVFFGLLGYERSQIESGKLRWEELIAQTSRSSARVPDVAPALIELRHNDGSAVPALSASLLFDPEEGLTATYIIGLDSFSSCASLATRSQSKG